MTLGTKHTWPRTQNAPCPGGKKSVFPLICHSIASNIPFPPAPFQRQMVNTAVSWGRRSWLLTWKVVSEKIKYLPQVTLVLTPKSDFASHNQFWSSTWCAKIPHRIPDYILAKVVRSYTLQAHLLTLRVLTRSNSVVADQVVTRRFCTNKGI